MDNLVGSICSFECLNRHILDGNTNMECQLDDNNISSSWVHDKGTNDYPICKSTCNELKSPSNGEMTCALSMAVAPIDGDSCEFNCDLGFNLIGSAMRECKTVDMDMQWSGNLSQCEPMCEAVIDIDHGIVNCSDNNLVGSQCKYSCLETYSLTHHQHTNASRRDFNIKCEKFDDEIAKWSATAPSCEPICPELAGSIKNGNIICSGVNKGDSCQIECDDSFNINGMDTLECILNPKSSNSVSWNGSPGKCEPTCPPTDAHKKDFIEILNMTCTNSNLIGSKCEFNCYKGSIIVGENEKNCLKLNETNAEWSHSNPICEPVCEPVSEIHNATVRCDLIDNNEVIKINDTCSISCDDNFQLNGSNILTCSTINNKTAFYPDVPKCLPKCQMLEDIENGYATCSDKNSIGSKHGFANCTNFLSAINKAKPSKSVNTHAKNCLN